MILRHINTAKLVIYVAESLRAVLANKFFGLNLYAISCVSSELGLEKVRSWRDLGGNHIFTEGKKMMTGDDR